MVERRILESWKAIAAYLGRTEKTCRTWEHDLGLPVHRLEESARARVFAYADELDRWREEKLQAGAFQMAEGRAAAARKARSWVIPGAALAVIALVSAFLIWRGRPRGEMTALQAAKGIAVLPFVDLSLDKSQEHIGDGISDILINTLNRVEGLRVPARTSAFYFKGKDVTPAEIGRRLKVEWILEGSVQVEGKRLRVVATLLRAADGTSLWAERYDRNEFDIFAVEDDIARMVVNSLKVKAMGQTNASLIKAGTKNPEAHSLYLQGRHFWNKRSKLDLLKSIDYYEKAVALDANYALAYVGLADAYNILGNNLFVSPDKAYPKGKAYALKALEIDETEGEAHRCLATVYRDYEWDFSAAGRELERALALSPGDSLIHHGYAFFLSNLGRHEDAVSEIRLARDLDPLAPRTAANVGLFLYNARRYEEAVEELKKALDFDPTHAATHEYLGEVYRELGRYDEAIAHYRSGINLEDRTPFLIRLAIAYARAGDVEQSRRILADLGERSKRESVPLSYLAVAYASIGEKDTAFILLDRACASREPRLISLKVDPIFDPLRDDPRFKDLLRRVGLEQ